MFHFQYCPSTSAWTKSTSVGAGWWGLAAEELAGGGLAGGGLAAEELAGGGLAGGGLATEELAGGGLAAEELAGGGLAGGGLAGGGLAAEELAGGGLAGGGLATEELAGGGLAAEELAGDHLLAEQQSSHLALADIARCLSDSWGGQTSGSWAGWLSGPIIWLWSQCLCSPGANSSTGTLTSACLSVWQERHMHERWRVHWMFCSAHFSVHCVKCTSFLQGFDSLVVILSHLWWTFSSVRVRQYDLLSCYPFSLNHLYELFPHGLSVSGFSILVLSLHASDAACHFFLAGRGGTGCDEVDGCGSTLSWLSPSSLAQWH